MRKLILVSGLVAAMAVPNLASAYTSRCERDRSSDRAAGTVAGGVLGALAGSAIAGRGDRTEGAIIGGVVGAVAGNQLSKSKRPCPAGYTYRQYDDRYYRKNARQARAACRWEDRPYRDAYGSYVPHQVQVCR
ncbi:MAG: glycine zipper 2TM domain-containing protein [Caulobacteraceae bacterium]